MIERPIEVRGIDPEFGFPKRFARWAWYADAPVRLVGQTKGGRIERRLKMIFVDLDRSKQRAEGWASFGKLLELRLHDTRLREQVSQIAIFVHMRDAAQGMFIFQQIGNRSDHMLIEQPSPDAGSGAGSPGRTKSFRVS